MKKAISVLLVLVVVCICSVSVMAEDGVMPRYTGISTFSGTVTISGRTVNTSVTGTLWDGYTGKLTAALQERGPDGVWKTVANYLVSLERTLTDIEALDSRPRLW